MDIQKAIENTESFLKWHKTTKDWLRDDRPFHHVFTYNLILDYYQQLDQWHKELENERTSRTR